MAATPAAARLTEVHRQTQSRIAAQTVTGVAPLWRILDPDDLARTSPAWATAVSRVVGATRATSAAAGAQYLRAFRAAEVGGRPASVLLSDTPNLRRLTTSLLVTGPIAVRQSIARGVPVAAAMAQAQSTSAAAAMRHTLDGGPVYGEETVDFPAHDHCGCTPEPVYRDDAQWPAGSREYRDLWDEAKAAEGDTVTNFRSLVADPARRPDLTAARGVDLNVARTGGRVPDLAITPAQQRALTAEANAADIARRAEALDVTPDEYRGALRQVDDFRAAARVAARREADDLLDYLERNDLTRVARPNRAVVRRDGRGSASVRRDHPEWDFLETLDDVERRRLGRWLVEDSAGAVHIDDLPALLGDPGMSLAEATERWLEMTRRQDALRSLASGRVPRYWDDIDALVPDLSADGIDVATIFAGDPHDAAAMILRLAEDAAEDAARRIVNAAPAFRHGPAPWRMTVDSYRGELLDVEEALRDARLAGVRDRVAEARWHELIPDADAFDAAGRPYSPEDLHNRYVAAARIAGRQ
jgi:hypothetical protein